MEYGLFEASIATSTPSFHTIVTKNADAIANSKLNGGMGNDNVRRRRDVLISLSGGLAKAADSSKDDYYDQFTLDYGKEETERAAGSLRGFLKSGALSKLQESDPFKKWLNEHLEMGPEDVKGRIKPFYAADFGTKEDLSIGESETDDSQS
jgi:hypothetical protein